MSTSPPPPDIHVTYSKQFRRCNKPGCPTCVRGPGHGPYWYAYWRAEGRLRSRYVGKALPPEAALAATSHSSASPAAGSASTYPALRVSTLGGFAVWRGDEPVPAASWAQRKVAALFTCLLSAPGQRAHRDYLQEMLWPEADPVVGARSLRVTIHRLRRVLSQDDPDGGYIRLEGHLLTLWPAPGSQPAEQWFDADVFERAADAALAGQDAAPCRAALALYGGDYLPEDLYDEWAATRRETLRQRYLSVLLHLATLREGQGVVGEAARCLHVVLVTDPCHEPAARALMRLQVLSGRSAEALRTYRQLAEALQRDLGLTPDVHTQQDYHTLLANRLTPAKPRTNLPTPPTSFLGRDDDLAVLAPLLRPPADDDEAPTMLLDQQRSARCSLLTLTGVGGCGKTRLALELGHELLATMADGVWLVELAALTDPAMVPLAVAQTCGLPDAGEHSPVAALVECLRPRQMLLVLDNCEHLIAACADLVAALLAGCPHLRILATSREPLDLPGEVIRQVQGLPAPDPRRLPHGQDPRDYAAVRLLVERGQAVRPGFALTPRNSRAALEVCCRLDGLPLAIELAAARLAVLSVEQLAARLDDRFQLLTTVHRATLPRHQTLRAVMDWSYALLDEAERTLLRRLAVFAGSCTLDGADALMGASTLEVLARLVTKSLVLVDDQDGLARYSLLETVRQYAREHLEASGEATLAADRQAAWCLTLAQEAAEALQGPLQGEWLRRLEREHDNLRTALGWLAGSSGRLARAAAGDSREQRGDPALDADAGLRLASLLWRFWDTHGHLGEGRRWLEIMLALDVPLPQPEHQTTAAAGRGHHAVRALALRGAAILAGSQGQFERARALYQESLALYRALDDRQGVADALNGLGTLATAQGDQAGAAAHEEALAARRAIGDSRGVAVSLFNLGSVALGGGDLRRAAALYGECLALWRQWGDPGHVALALSALGEVAHTQGDGGRAGALLTESLTLYQELASTKGIASARLVLAGVARARGDAGQALDLYQQSRTLFEELEDTQGAAHALAGLGALAADGGDHEQATACLTRSLTLLHEVGDKRGIALVQATLAGVASACGDDHAADLYRESFLALQAIGDCSLLSLPLDGLARVACARGQFTRAARLWGAVAALETCTGAPLPLPEQRRSAPAVAAARAALGDTVFQDNWVRGQGLPLESVLQEAP